MIVAVYSAGTVFLPCSAREFQTLGSVLAHDHPEGIKPKTRQYKIKVWCKVARAVRAKKRRKSRAKCIYTSP